MRNDPTLRPTLRQPAPSDGWLGTRELPGYRAGRVIVRLNELPTIAPDHLYFDLLLLDDEGRTQDTHSGPCGALARHRAPDERSRFVRVVAELVRHAPSRDRGLAAIGQALSYIRESGVEAERLITAAQLLDNACSERAVIASLCQVLRLSLGDDGAHREMCDVITKLARSAGFAALCQHNLTQPAGQSSQTVQGAQGLQAAADPTTELPFSLRVDAINNGGLPSQVSFVVRTVGKAKARRYLRELVYFDLVPQPEMFGV